VVASVHAAFVEGFQHLCAVIEEFGINKQFVQDVRPDEKRHLQAEMLKLLRVRGCRAREGQEIGGGETDIILPGDLVVENKVAEVTTDLSSLKPDAAWQARRYSITLNRRLSFVVIAYKPATESQLVSMPGRVSIFRLESTPEECAYVRLLVPWGYGTPSDAKAVRP
jgi:hypothetical protein